MPNDYLSRPVSSAGRPTGQARLGSIFRSQPSGQLDHFEQPLLVGRRSQVGFRHDRVMPLTALAAELARRLRGCVWAAGALAGFGWHVGLVAALSRCAGRWSPEWGCLWRRRVVG